MTTLPDHIKKLIRPNILTLEPYRCARDDYDSGILLDANENAYGPPLVQHDDNELPNDTLKEFQLERYWARTAKTPNIFGRSQIVFRLLIICAK